MIEMNRDLPGSLPFDNSVGRPVIPPPMVSHQAMPTTRMEATIMPRKSALCSPCSSFDLTTNVPRAEAMMPRAETTIGSRIMPWEAE